MNEYSRGWQNSVEYRRDTKHMNEAGSVARALGFLFLLYGSMSSLMILLMAFTDLYGPATGWNGLRQPFSTYLVLAGFAGCLVSIYFFRRAGRTYRQAKAAFDTKWTKTDEADPAPKDIEGMQEALAKPLVADDLKLITQASIRLTKDYPDLADQLAILKVRIQKTL